MNLDMRKFYGIASILMGFALFGNTWNLFNVWNNITIGARIANIAGSVLFNLLLFALFFGLWRITPKNEPTAKIINNPDLDAMIKQYSGEPQSAPSKKKVAQIEQSMPSFEDFSRKQRGGSLHL